MGITKKGKEFFKLTSSVTESISTVIVEETQIWTSCEYVFNRYDNGQDSAFFMSRDRINCIAIERIHPRENQFYAILGCKDSCLRIVNNSSLICEIPTDASVTAIAIFSNGLFTGANSTINIVAGLDNGNVCFIQFDKSGEYKTKWTYEDPLKITVTSLRVFPLTGNKINGQSSKEIITGREDGRLEILLAEQTRSSFTSQMIYSMDFNESIKAIECGIVNTIGYNEIILALNSGKIVSLTTEPVNLKSTDDQYGRSVHTLNNENRLKALKKEVDTLKIQVEKENEKLKKLQPRHNLATPQLTPLPPELNVNYKWNLDKEKGAYILMIELQYAIDMIMIKSPVKLDIIETDVLGTAVLSISPTYLLNDSNLNGTNNNTMTPSASNSLASVNNPINKFTAVLRCQNQEKRVMLVVRSTEGAAGEVLVTVVADTRPKAAKVSFLLVLISLSMAFNILHFIITIVTIIVIIIYT